MSHINGKSYSSLLTVLDSIQKCSVTTDLCLHSVVLCVSVAVVVNIGCLPVQRSVVAVIIDHYNFLLHVT